MRKIVFLVVVLAAAIFPRVIMATESATESIKRLSTAVAEFEDRANAIYRKYGVIKPAPPAESSGKIPLRVMAVEHKPQSDEERQTAMTQELQALAEWFKGLFEGTCVRITGVTVSFPPSVDVHISFDCPASSE